MRKSIAFATIAAALSLSAASAQANGWGGYNTNNNYSSGLVNVSPTVKTGDVNVLSGILSGNSILSGNNTGVGILGTGTGVISNVLGITSNSYNKSGKK